MSQCKKCGCQIESPFDGKTIIHNEEACGLETGCGTCHHACDCREMKLMEMLLPICAQMRVAMMYGDKVALRHYTTITDFWREQYGVEIFDYPRVKRRQIELSMLS